jgi:DnaJ family protein C protein 1
MNPLLVALLLSSLPAAARSWDAGMMEVFDVVDKVEHNFYDFMGIDPDASPCDIRKAYRNLSLLLHPDKSAADDAEVKFGWLVDVYEVLKDPAKREAYDRMLSEGVARTPLYYYWSVKRKVKLGLPEGLVLLFLAVHAMQYVVDLFCRLLSHLAERLVYLLLIVAACHYLANFFTPFSLYE